MPPRPTGASKPPHALLLAGHPPVWDPGAEEGHGVVRLLRGSLPRTPGPAEPPPG